MITPIIISYVSVSLLVTLLSIGRRITFAGAFITSILMSPIIGLVAVLNSSKNVRVSYYTTRYTCPSCNIEYTENKETCDFCKEMGKEIKLEANRVLIKE